MMVCAQVQSGPSPVKRLIPMNKRYCSQEGAPQPRLAPDWAVSRDLNFSTRIMVYSVDRLIDWGRTKLSS